MNSRSRAPRCLLLAISPIVSLPGFGATGSERASLKILTITALLACILGASTVKAIEPVSLPAMQPPISEIKPGDFVFELLPKSMQRNPQLDMTVSCQLTEYGRTVAPATPEHPVYYLSQYAGLQEYGELIGGRFRMDQKYLDQLFTRSLSTNGYLPAVDDMHRPTLILIYQWGSFYAMSNEDRRIFPLLAFRQDSQRAALVRGFRPVGSRAQGNRNTYGGEFFGSVSRSYESEFLSYQSRHDLYFAVVSAYEYAALAKGEHKLVWRATLTVNGEGVSMEESLPPLVLTAGTTFGRDTGGARIVSRRVRRSSVTLGPLIILENDVPDPEKSDRR